MRDALEQKLTVLHVSGAVLCALYLEGIVEFDRASMDKGATEKMKQYFIDKTVAIIVNKMEEAMKTIGAVVWRSALSSGCDRIAMETPIKKALSQTADGL